ncbi:MAG: YitT family protein, partial [Clostridia bacterium]|nr:YitT family protein [Clostridia bacterium]
VCIISEHEDELKQFILHDLDAGCTIYEAHGAYDNRTRNEIVTILDKNKYKKLLDKISKLDPTAFVTVLPIHEVYTPEH